MAADCSFAASSAAEEATAMQHALTNSSHEVVGCRAIQLGGHAVLCQKMRVDVGCDVMFGLCLARRKQRL